MNDDLQLRRKPTWRDVRDVLKRAGGVSRRCKGTHEVWTLPNGRTVTIAVGHLKHKANPNVVRIVRDEIETLHRWRHDEEESTPPAPTESKPMKRAVTIKPSALSAPKGKVFLSPTQFELVGVVRTYYETNSEYPLRHEVNKQVPHRGRAMRYKNRAGLSDILCEAEGRIVLADEGVQIVVIEDHYERKAAREAYVAALDAVPVVEPTEEPEHDGHFEELTQQLRDSEGRLKAQEGLIEELKRTNDLLARDSQHFQILHQRTVEERDAHARQVTELRAQLTCAKQAPSKSPVRGLVEPLDVIEHWELPFHLGALVMAIHKQERASLEEGVVLLRRYLKATEAV